MLESGIIEPSMSPWASPVLLVAKKSTGQTRLVCDYRKLNNILKKCAHTLPLIEETLSLLHSKKHFSVLDLANGYFQIEMETKDKEKTAIVVDNNLYHFNRMPQGLSASSNTFFKLMQFVFGDIIGSKALVYLDDLIVFSNTFEEHLVNLREVFNRLKQAGLKLQPAKCDFFQRRSRIFRTHHFRERNRSQRKKDGKITNFLVPRNVKNLCQNYFKICVQL